MIRYINIVMSCIGTASKDNNSTKKKQVDQHEHYSKGVIRSVSLEALLSILPA